MTRKELEQNKLKLKLIKEIKSLECLEKHYRIYKLKKNLEIIGRVSLYLIPFPIISLTEISLFNNIGLGYPFIKDDIKYYAHTKTIIDNYGNINVESMYASFDNEENTLNYYTKWAENYDNTYTRVKEIYNIENLSYEKIDDIINGNITISSVLENPIRTITETNTNISNNNDYYIEVILYDIDENNYTYIKENSSNNLINTNKIILCLLFSNLIIYTIIPKPDLNSIKDKYEYYDLENIRTRLKIKKDNLKTLTR